jgi:hypothetical protein
MEGVYPHITFQKFQKLKLSLELTCFENVFRWYFSYSAILYFNVLIFRHSYFFDIYIFDTFSFEIFIFGGIMKNLPFAYERLVTVKSFAE